MGIESEESGDGHFCMGCEADGSRHKNGSADGG